MVTVKATREGLIGGKTATGYKVETTVPFVALPSSAALRQWVRVYNPLNGKSCTALVLDVGPWNEQDHAYVFQDATRNGSLTAAVTSVPAVQDGVRPKAERGYDEQGRKTNGAGIDLGERVWNELGMADNGLVCWEFVM